MAPKKIHNILLVYLTNNNQEFYKRVLNSLKTILQRKMFENNCWVQAYHVSSDKTYHPYPEEVNKPIDFETFQSIMNNLEKVPLETEKAPVIKFAIKLANNEINSFFENSSKDIGYMQILIFSDDINEQIPQAILDKHFSLNNVWYKENKIKLYIFGPDDIRFSCFDKDFVQLKEEFKNCAQLKNNNLLHKFLIGTNSLVCSLKDGEHLLEYYRPVSKNPTYWRTDFRIGNKLKIPIICYRYTHPTKKFQLIGKFDKEDNLNETDPYHMDTDSPIKPEQTDELNNEEEEDSAIALTTIEWKTFKPSTIRCFDLLFTIEKSKICEEIYHIGDSTLVLTNDDDEPVGEPLLKAFIKNLAEENLYGVVRRVYNQRYYPSLFLLKPETDSTCLAFQIPFKDYLENPLAMINDKSWKLPTKDDIEILNNSDSNREKESVIFEYLSNFELDSRNDIPCSLPFHMQFNPQHDAIYNHIINCLEAKDNQNSVATVDLNVLKMPESIEKNKKETEEKLRSMLF